MNKETQKKVIKATFECQLHELTTSLTSAALDIAYGRVSQTALIAKQLKLISSDEFRCWNERVRVTLRQSLNGIYGVTANEQN